VRGILFEPETSCTLSVHVVHAFDVQIPLRMRGAPCHKGYIRNVFLIVVPEPRANYEPEIDESEGSLHVSCTPSSLYGNSKDGSPPSFPSERLGVGLDAPSLRL